MISIIEEAKKIADDRLLSSIMNNILSSERQMPAELILQVVEVRIATELRLFFKLTRTQLLLSIVLPAPADTNSTPLCAPEKLPRYLRCLFQLCTSLPAQQQDAESRKATEIAESIISYVLTLSRQVLYPGDELEWVATVAFNRAVDFYFDSAEEECRRWVRGAIELADLLGGSDGALGRLLRANLARLGVDA